MKKSAIILVDYPDGAKEIVTDEPEYWVRNLKARNMCFICFPMSMPIPRNKDM